IPPSFVHLSPRARRCHRVRPQKLRTRLTVLFESMKKLLILFLAFSAATSAQIRGTVTDEQGNPLPFVSINIENTYRGTTTNDVGKYELATQTPGKYTLVFQYLGYKTKKVSADINTFPHMID